MRTRNYDDWTVERWRLEPQHRTLEFDEVAGKEDAPPLWKDLILASVAAALLWAAAALVFG